MIKKLVKPLHLAALLLMAPAAWAETINCTPITTLPYVITVQGVYCFTGNLATTMGFGNAIEIKTNNVTIDMNGWKLGGLAAGPGTQTIGIFADQRKNITIRNGVIRGFYMGVDLKDASPFTTSQGHLIEDIRADKNLWVGFRIIGRGNTVRRNQIVATGGSTRIGDSYGVILLGSGARLLNNDISSTTASGTGTSRGVWAFSANGAVLEHNRIDNVSAASGAAWGIGIGSSTDVIVEENRINGVSSSGATDGVYISSSFNVMVSSSHILSADTGIKYAFSSTGKFMGNLTGNVTTPFSGGTAVGTNN